MALSKIGLIDPTAITGTTALAAVPALTDEILLSDAGTLKRIDYTHIQTGWVKEFESTLTGSDTGGVDVETTALFDVLKF